MKRMILFFVFLVFGMISFGSAFQANVTLQEELGSFSGAYLKIKSVDSSVFSDDKIYPSEFLVGVGIVKFNLEISLSEIDMKFKLIKDGRAVDEFEVGPYLINGSDILIDRREKAEVVEVMEVADINESVEENVTENASEVVVENISDEVVIVEDETSEEEEKSSGFLAGLVTSNDGGIPFNWKYSLGGGLAVLLLAVFVFAMAIHRRKSGNVTMGDDEKELEYMEKKVREIEGKITKIKHGGKIKKKLEAAKAKLAEEEAELKELEHGGNEKKIEEQEKVVDQAEEKVEDAKD